MPTGIDLTVTAEIVNPQTSGREETPSTTGLPRCTITAVTTKSRSRSKRGWRFQALNLYLTYPQCTTSRQTCLDNLKTKFGENLLWAVIAQEKHEDQNDHIHILAKLNKQYRSCNPNDLDSITGSHGNYQSARNLTSVMKYVTKEDPKPLCFHIDPLLFLANRKGKKEATISSQIAGQIKEGRTLQEVDKQFPGYLLLHKSKVEAYLNWQKILSQRSAKKEWKLIDLEEVTRPMSREIANWLNQALGEKEEASSTPTDPNPRTLGFQHLWIHGPTGIGKTHLITELSKRGVRVYEIPPDEDWYDQYEDGCYDVAILEEFKAQKRIQWLNKWCDGTPGPLKKRFTQYVKKQFMPTIVLSNYSIKGCYSKSNDFILASLSRRFLVVGFDASMQRIDVFGQDN